MNFKPYPGCVWWGGVGALFKFKNWILIIVLKALKWKFSLNLEFRKDNFGLGQIDSILYYWKLDFSVSISGILLWNEAPTFKI